MSDAGEPTGFLYPFLDGRESDADALVQELAESARAKANQSAALGARAHDENAEVLAAAAAAMAARFGSGGRLLAFGNGGSATDAASASHLFATPPTGRPLAAQDLTADVAIVTALANDVGFDLVFVRQLIAQGGADDIAFGISTSGGSRNVLEAFATARDLGLLTVALVGYDGGEVARSPHVDHCLVVRSDSVHRVQEAQAALACALWTAVQQAMEPVRA